MVTIYIYVYTISSSRGSMLLQFYLVNSFVFPSYNKIYYRITLYMETFIAYITYF